jgi:hypothetical protein
MAAGGEGTRAITRDEWLEIPREKREQHIQLEYGPINANQMRALSIKGMHTWLLQGTQLVKTGRLVDDTFFDISSYLLKLPAQETKAIFHAVQMKLFNDMTSRIDRKNTGCFSFFKSEKKANTKRNEAILRYEDRTLLAI